VQNKKVSAILSLDATAEVAVAPYLQSARVPLLGVTFTPTVAENPNVFNVTTGVGSFVQGVVAAAKLEGATKFGLLYCNESPACAASAPIYEQYAPTLDMEFTGKLGVDGDAPNYTAPCLSLIEKGTDFIELDTSGAGQARIAADCVAQGYRGAFGGVASTFTPEIYKDIAGSTWIGSLNSFPWWVDAAPVVEYRDAIAKYDSSLNYNGSAPSAAWTSLQLFAKAMENADDVSAAGVTEAMGTIKDETLGGLLASPVTLDPTKPTVSPTCFWAVKYVAGEETPTVIGEGDSGNGATDGLESTCLSS
jgi:branched-chain amino acid transport system substrate-binding protein